MTNLKAAECLTQMYAYYVRKYGSEPEFRTAVTMAIMALKETEND